MRSTLCAGLVSLLLSSFAWAQEESVQVTFDFEHLPPGEIPPEGVVIARMLSGEPIPGYIPDDPGNDGLLPHIAIRVSRPGAPLSFDSLSVVPGRPAAWGSRTLSPFGDPLSTSRLVIEILHVPENQGVELIQWEMGDFVPSDFDEYEFQTFADAPADPPSIPGGGLLAEADRLPDWFPEADFQGYSASVQRAHPINRFEIIGGSEDFADLYPPFPHSVYYDNFVFTISSVGPGTNAFAEGTDVPASDFGGDFLSAGVNGPGGDTNSPPTASASGAGTYECGRDDVVLGGTVADLEGGDLTYEWVLIGPDEDETLHSGTITVDAGGAAATLPDLNVPSTDLGVGLHTIELRVTDAALAEDVDAVEVEVVDTTPPTLAPVSSHCQLWPPDHRLVTVTIQPNASDNCCGTPTLSVAVSSDEPVDGTGDGKFAPDWTDPVIDPADGTITLELRAERSGSGDGRTYTIDITATDCNGNASVVPVTIPVPHGFGKQGKK